MKPIVSDCCPRQQLCHGTAGRSKSINGHLYHRISTKVNTRHAGLGRMRRGITCYASGQPLPWSPLSRLSTLHIPSHASSRHPGSTQAWRTPLTPRTASLHSSAHTLHAAAIGGAATLPAEAASGVVDLDWKPKLATWQVVLTFVLPAVLCALGFGLAPPPAITPKYLLVCAGVYAMLVYTTRLVITEKLYDARQQTESALAEPGSKFEDVGGLKVYAKVVDGTAQAARPPDSKILALHLFHGFGANIFSWSFVQTLLAQRLTGIVTSHDQPGFGLTQRPASLSAYLLTYNGHLGRAVMEKELAARSLVGTDALKNLLARYDFQPASGRATSSSTASQTPSRVKRVLVGHSMGCISAALETISSPQDIEALILVAPAILMTPGESKKLKDATLTEMAEQPLPTESTNGTTVSTVDTPAPPTLAQSPPPLDSLSPSAETLATPPPAPQEVPVVLTATTATGATSNEAAISSSVSPSGDATEANALEATPTAATGSSMAADAAAGAQSFAIEVESETTSVAQPETSAPTTPPPSSLASYPLKHFQSFNGSTATPPAAGALSPANLVARLVRAVVNAVQVLFVTFFLAALLPVRPVLQLLLRNMVRSKDFWKNGLSLAYYNAAKVTGAVVDGYRRPRLVSGFDVALLRFVTSRATNGGNLVGMLTGAPREDDAIPERLAAATASHNIKVLIIHGKDDRAVPLSNSRLLAKAVNGAELVEVDQCGHVPHEELPECFVEIVAEFLDRRVLNADA